MEQMVNLQVIFMEKEEHKYRVTKNEGPTTKVSEKINNGSESGIG